MIFSPTELISRAGPAAHDWMRMEMMDNVTNTSMEEDEEARDNMVVGH